MEKKNLMMVAFVTMVAIGLVLSVTFVARGVFQALSALMPGG